MPVTPVQLLGFLFTQNSLVSEGSISIPWSLNHCDPFLGKPAGNQKPETRWVAINHPLKASGMFFLMKYLHQHASTRFFFWTVRLFGERKKYWFLDVSGIGFTKQMSYEFFPKLVNLSMFQLPDWESELLWHLAAMGNHNLDRTWSKQWIFKGKSTGNQGFTIKYRGFL